MTNRQISIRIGMEGGADVTRSIDEITRAGTDGFDRMAASWGKTGEAADKYKAQLQQIAEAAKQAALADEVNQSWSKFLGVSDQVTNSAREAAGAFKDAEASTIGWSQALGVGTQVLGTFGVALSAAAAARFGEQVFESTAQLENQAKVLGISTDALQAYHAAAVESGAGADVGDAAIRRFTRSLGDAQAGVKLQAEAFHDLGISTADLAGGTEAVLPQVAAALLDIQDASQRARIETELFGRAGQDVEQVLKQWADPEIVGHMRDLGLVIDRELVQRAAEADKAWNLLWLHIKADSASLLLSDSAGPQWAKDLVALLDRLDPTIAGGPSNFAPSASDLAGIAGEAGARHNAFAQSLQIPTVTPNAINTNAVRDSIETAEALIQFHADLTKILDLDEQAKKVAEEYQNALDRAGITNAPANLVFGGRTALEAAQAGIGSGGVPIAINRDGGFSTVATSGPRDVLQGIAAASRSQLIPDEAQFAADRLVDKIQEEARIAALLPQYRQSELEILNEQYRRHVELSDAQKQEIRNAEELKIRNEEIAQTINQMQGDFANFLKTAETTGKLSFGSLFRSILSDWEDMLNKMIAQQAFQQIFGGSTGGLGGIFGALFGGGSIPDSIPITVSSFHSGGIAGDVTATRQIGAGAFMNAPRYHLGIDEVPAILQKGERVVPRSMVNGSSAQVVNLHVYVEGANGDQHVVDLVNQGVGTALAAYDGNLDRRINQPVQRIIRQPRFRG